MAISRPSLLDSTKAIESQLGAPILQMPVDILCNQIFPRLVAQEIGPLTLVCRQWCKLFEDDNTFHSIFSCQFPRTDEMNIRNFKNSYHFYSSVINNEFALSTVWPEERSSHSSYYSLKESGFFSCSMEHTIQLLDIETGRCTATFQGHENIVSNIIRIGEKLFSYSWDQTAKIWDIKTGSCIITFQEHGTITASAAAGQKLFVGMLDGRIKILDIETGKYISDIQGHKSGVLCLALAGRLLFSGSADKTIKVWDIEKGSCIATFQGHENKVSCFAPAGRLLFSGSLDKTIKVWDIEKGSCIATFQGHEGQILCLALAGPLLFSSSLDNKIKVWDIEKGSCIATLPNFTSPVLAFVIVGQKLFFFSLRDYALKTFDFTADRYTLFDPIAKLLETGSPEAIQEALERFSQTPIKARHNICALIHEILDGDVKPTIDENNERAARPEDIFYDRCKHRTATSDQKAQAIWEYLFIPSLHGASSSGFSANGKRTYETAFDPGKRS